MNKWAFSVLFLLLLASCESAEESQVDTKIIAEESIRIYSDSIGWEDKTLCKIVYAGKEYKAKIKFRGGVSSKYPKHSMTVELDKEVSVGGLPANDDWILNASFIDKTFQRHKLSYDIFSLMDAKNKAPQCTYLPVYLNDKSIGVYVIMEKVNGSWLGFDGDNPQMALLFKDPFVFVQERLPNIQEPDNYYQQKFPKIENIDCTEDMEAFKKFLFESDDETFSRIYKRFVDERNVIDWHLLLLLTNNDDGIFKNFYLYQENDGSKFQFIPWDYDHSFGRDGDYSLNLIDREVGWQKVVLLRRLMGIPETGYAVKLKERYIQLRKFLFTNEVLLKMVAKNDAHVKPYLDENAEVWPLDSKWYLDANGYEEEIEIIRNYIPMRLQQLDDFFSTLDYGEEE